MRSLGSELRLGWCEQALSMLKKFQAILQRDSLKEDLDSKFMVIFHNYGEPSLPSHLMREGVSAKGYGLELEHPCERGQGLGLRGRGGRSGKGGKARGREREWCGERGARK